MEPQTQVAPLQPQCSLAWLEPVQSSDQPSVQSVLQPLFSHSQRLPLREIVQRLTFHQKCNLGECFIITKLKFSARGMCENFGKIFLPGVSP